jgi:hypothetical protein
VTDLAPFDPGVDRIVLADGGATFRASIEDVRLPRNVSAGCNFLKLGAYAHQLRGTTEDLDPVVVAREPDGSWRIVDGRHRFLAAVIAGRPDVLCIQASEEAA